MNRVVVILGMAAVTYAIRLGGFSLGKIGLSPFWLRVLHCIPLAVFAAVIVSALPGQRGEWAPRLIAAACAGLVLWRSRQLWAGIVVGLGLLWLMRLI